MSTLRDDVSSSPQRRLQSLARRLHENPIHKPTVVVDRSPRWYTQANVDVIDRRVTYFISSAMCVILKISNAIFLRWLMANIAVIVSRLSVRVLTSDCWKGGGTVAPNKRQNPKYASPRGYYTLFYMKGRLSRDHNVIGIHISNGGDLIWFFWKPNDRILKFNIARHSATVPHVMSNIIYLWQMTGVNALDCIILYWVIRRACSSPLIFLRQTVYS